jgi:flagellar basal-body rod protein FlgF
MRFGPLALGASRMYGMYLSAAGAATQLQRHDVIANNMANVDTVGYKADVPVFTVLPAESKVVGVNGGAYGGDELKISDKLGGIRLIMDTMTTFESGSANQTGRPTDARLEENDTFFVVRRGNQELYTRAGNFVRRPDGQLGTADGKSLVMGAKGPIRLENDKVYIRPDGVIEGENKTAIDRLAVVRFSKDDLKMLQKTDGAAFRAPAGVKPQATDARVAGGELENSAVSAVGEMVDLIEAQRAYQNNMSAIRIQDGILGRVVTEIARLA